MPGARTDPKGQKKKKKSATQETSWFTTTYVIGANIEKNYE